MWTLFLQWHWQSMANRRSEASGLTQEITFRKSNQEAQSYTPTAHMPEHPVKQPYSQFTGVTWLWPHRTTVEVLALTTTTGQTKKKEMWAKKNINLPSQWRNDLMCDLVWASSNLSDFLIRNIFIKRNILYLQQQLLPRICKIFPRVMITI